MGFLDGKFEDSYWSEDSQVLRREDFDEIYNSVTGIVEAVEEGDYEAAVLAGEELANVDKELADQMVEYLVDRAPEGQFEELDSH